LLRNRRVGCEVSIRPPCHGACNKLGIIRACQQVIRSIQADETLWVECSFEDAVGFGNIDGGIDRRMHDQQCLAQPVDSILHWVLPEVVQKRPVDSKLPAAERDVGFAFCFEPLGIGAKVRDHVIG
jgi:hypothetical protein